MNILKLLFIIQQVDNKKRKEKGLPTIGNYRNPQRLNPYNPLVYLFLPFYFIIAPIIYGYYTFFTELKTTTNPFKWR